MSTDNANESERRQFRTQRALAMGAEYPFDARAEWDEHGDRVSPPPPVDWAHAAARGVIADMSDRRGLRDLLDSVQRDVRVNIVQSIADIIRSAAPCNGGGRSNAATLCRSMSSSATHVEPNV